MSRGRGWGRGRGFGGGGGFGIVKTEPYLYFPEDVELPDVHGITEEKTLANWNVKLLNYWKFSPYYIEDKAQNTPQLPRFPIDEPSEFNLLGMLDSNDVEIERYSDKYKPKKKRRDPLSYYLKLTPTNFPLELIQGSKRVQHDQSKLQWNPDSSDAFTVLDKVDKKFKDHVKELQAEKKAKEDESEEENGENIEEESSNDEIDDYTEGQYFDDDEDDFNPGDDNNEEDYYE
ncbi:hypothetical protein GIB67_035105 [Kingdonia uniflora]|uniref:DNA-directed RNA polymerase III subunit n=1 Tax=Kingdonia uniflora TaxID=39325 RepID=A0A7J7NCD4_9MAGN|nr:hypothetical protein GIB67_035105 [Kingdonia uniflora]